MNTNNPLIIAYTKDHHDSHHDGGDGNSHKHRNTHIGFALKAPKIEYHYYEWNDDELKWKPIRKEYPPPPDDLEAGSFDGQIKGVPVSS
jgi:hypothetical protein